MAIFGDLGKLFGLGSTKEELGKVGGTIGSFFGPKGAAIGTYLGEEVGEFAADSAGEVAPTQPNDDYGPHVYAHPAAPETATELTPMATPTAQRQGNGFWSQALQLGGAALAGYVAGELDFGGGGSQRGLPLVPSGRGRGRMPYVTRKHTQQARMLIRMMGADQAARALRVSPAYLAYVATKVHRRNMGITSAQMRTTTRTVNRIVHLNKKLETAYGRAVRRRTTRRAK